MIRYIILIFILVGFFISVKSQTVYPVNYFSSPLQEGMRVGGSFGELRPNHFHSGVDIKTERIGLRLYAPADGYISRIRVSPFGYGNALYINHPNGYKTVYGHLNAYTKTVADYIKTKQYEKQEFSVNLYPLPDEFPVKKGDLIGYTGNTGRSSGPHLHYEVRKIEGDVPVNPLLFYPIADTFVPEIFTLGVYGIPGKGVVNGLQKKLINVIKSVPDYSIKESLTAYGQIYTGIEVYDYLRSGAGKASVYKLELYVNSKLIYATVMDAFSFFESGYINTFIDYESRINLNKRIQRTYVTPNNKLDIYTALENSGIVTINDGQVYTFNYVATDFNNNKTELKFKITGKKQIIPANKPGDIKLQWNTDNYFSTSDVQLQVYRMTLFEDTSINYSKTPCKLSKYSDLHTFTGEYIPFFSKAQLDISPKNIPENLVTKAVIARLLKNGTYESVGGDYKNNFISGKISSFGSYFVALDTVAPVMEWTNVSNKLNVRSLAKIQFRIRDNLSGIGSYNAYINNKWILLEYDGKSDMFTYTIEKEHFKKENILKLLVSDTKDNILTYTTILYWF